MATRRAGRWRQVAWIRHSRRRRNAALAAGAAECLELAETAVARGRMDSALWRPLGGRQGVDSEKLAARHCLGGGGCDVRGPARRRAVEPALDQAAVP